MKVIRKALALTLAFIMILLVTGISWAYAEEPENQSLEIHKESAADEAQGTLEEGALPAESCAKTDTAVEGTESSTASGGQPAEEIQANTEITDWQRDDEDGNLVYSDENQRWELNAPGASEDHPLISDAQTTAAAKSYPGGEVPFSGSVVQNDTYVPDTTINLFDYWLTGQFEDDTANQNPGMVYDLGINNGHALNFWDIGGTYISSRWNDLARNTAATNIGPVRGIVNSRLGGDGYPKLQLNNAEWFNGNDNYATVMGNYPGAAVNSKSGADTESLAYLFNPDISHGGKKSWSGVDGLLRLDENGYYSYDSDKNYAVFYENGSSGEFVLYDQPCVGISESGNRPGGFFPFNDATSVFSGSGDKITAQKPLQPGYLGMNHYFGISMSTRFLQEYGGHTGPDQKEPVTFEFTGDDDVWVFIDGVLVADLGGIHAAGTFTVNFSTGEVKVNPDAGQEGGVRYGYTTTLRSLFAASYGGNLEELFNSGSNTFKDGTYHTLDFFYLERGNGASNMSLKFNLSPVPESDVIKVDQMGNPVPGVRFDLYETGASYETAGAELLGSGTTDAEGSFVLTDTEGYALSLNNLYAEGVRNMVLRETEEPPGYRKSGDVNLELYNSQGNVVLLSKNHWDTGAYASAKVKITALEEELFPSGNGIVFAVPMKYVGDGPPSLNSIADWQPIYGNPLTEGWHVGDAGSMESVLKAAKANPHIFEPELGGNGYYTAEIESLPGDITSYYFMNETPTADKVRHVVMYFYVPGVTSLDQVNVNDIKLLDEEKISFSREFATRLFVSNIKNQLLVQKVDDQGTPVSGAEFTLTKEGDASWKQTVTTRNLTKTADNINLKGGGVFPAGGVLEEGTYILQETKAPDGYKINNTTTKIVVDDTGVYADAGNETDGVDVYRGVGFVVKSMLQFSTDNRIDTTLHDIKANLSCADSGSFPGSSNPWKIADPKQETHLQYNPAKADVEYAPPEPASVGGTTYPTALKVSSGWSKLMIQQCNAHQQTDIKDYKTDLGDKDITSLFSGTVVVQVENQRQWSLTLKKKVVDTGNIEPQDETYKFTLTGKKDSAPLNGTYRYTGTASGSLTFTNGTATVSLQDGQSITINGLTPDITIEVTEAAGEYDTSVSVDGSAGSSGSSSGEIGMADDTSHSVVFTNTYTPDLTADFTFTKTDSGYSPLAGASFGIYGLTCTNTGHDHSDDELVVDKTGNITKVTNGETGCWQKIKTDESDADGKITFSSLNQDAEYRLVEYKAPDGYVLPKGQWIVTYDKSTAKFEIEATDKDGTPAFDNTNRVINYRPNELPLTGNRGILIFLLAGGTLMLLGVGSYIIKMQKKRGSIKRRTRKF